MSGVETILTFDALNTSIIRRVQETMVGRMAYEVRNIDYLLTYVGMAGMGDYVETGVLHGGSLLAVALLKQALSLPGQVVGIDPFDGYYRTHPLHQNRVDPVSTRPVTREIVLENAARLGVADMVELIAAPSDPWPEVLAGRRFAAAYIDGDHWGGGPQADWLNISACTDRYVIFDNDDDQHPAVRQTCSLAGQSLDWRIVLRQGITCVLERVG